MNGPAGRKLRRELNKTLAAAGRELGKTLEWSEPEIDIIDRAAVTADRAAHMRAVFEAESAGEARPTVMVSLSGELRLLDRLVVDLVGKLNAGLGPAKSERHVRAAMYRWDRRKWEGA